MAVSADERKGIIYTWEIKNVSCFQGAEFCSPEFNGFQKTKWQLKFVPKRTKVNCGSMTTTVVCVLSRLEDIEGVKECSFTLDMTFYSGKCSWIALEATKYRYAIGSSIEGRVRRSDLTVGSSLVRNMTVRCRMWTVEKPCPSICSNRHAFTEFDAHYSFFECSIKQSVNGNFLLVPIHPLEESGNNSIAISSRFKETKVKFDIILVSDSIPNICTCHIYLKQDKKGSLLWLKESKKPAAYAKGQLWTFSLSCDWNDFVSKKKNHCLNDAVTLRLELVSSSGQVMYNTSSSILGGSEDDDIPMRKYNILCSSLLSMFQNNFLCDVQLKTTTKTFSAHKVVLSANSSVFRAMFTSDMKEKIHNSVDISDLEEHVIERLLNYAYSADVGEMTWDFALKLYYAADKYQMNPLKIECTNFLINNLSPKNICEALVLSDKHNDSLLQKSVQNFITNNIVEILDSKEWKDFKNEETMLALNFFESNFNSFSKG